MEWSKFYSVQQRYVLSLMGFLAIVNAYTMRVCLSLAITEMTTAETNSTGDDTKYQWSSPTQGLIHGSFFIGYVITHVPGALLCERFGGKYILGLGILSTAVFTILTPVTLKIGSKISGDDGAAGALIALRILMGIGEGTTFPALSSLLAAWIPQSERGKLGSFVFGGGQIGTIFSNVISGYLLQNYNWTSVFYFYGGLAIVWYIFFVFFCYSSPDEHPFIKESEKEYLHKELGHLKRGRELAPTPWKAILTSIPVMALVSAQIGHDWGFYIMVSQLPTYMKDVVGVQEVKNNGVYTALPFFAMWIVSIGSGAMCDYVINNNYITVTNARKALTAIAAVIPGALLLAASYAGKELVLVVTFFTLGIGIMGMWYPGMKVNPLDLSPNYAATIMAVSNGIGALTGIAAPYMAGLVTRENSGLLEWRIVIWITFGIFVVTTISYTIWASGEIQPWNDPEPNTREKPKIATIEKDENVERGSVDEVDDEKPKPE